MKKVIFWLVIILFIASFSIYQNQKTSSAKEAKSEILKLARGASSYTKKSTPISHFELKDANKNVLGYVVRTIELPEKVTGYGGEIDALVGFDLDGRVTGVKIISHSESPEYMGVVLNSGITKKMAGRTADQIQLLDAVTGATISSRALIRDIGTAVEHAANKLVGRKNSGILGGAPKSRRLTELLVFIPLIFGGIAVSMPRKRYLRIIAYISSLVVVGLILNAPVTIGDIINVSSGSVVLSAHIAVYILLAAAIIMAFVKGPFYCVYICPFGVLQEGSNAFAKSEVRPDSGIQKMLAYLRYPLVAGLVIAVTIFGIDILRYFEPFSLMFSRGAPSAVWIQAGVILVLAAFFRRIWCRFLCPTGFFMESLNEIGCRIRSKFRRCNEEK